MSPIVIKVAWSIKSLANVSWFQTKVHILNKSNVTIDRVKKLMKTIVDTV